MLFVPVQPSSVCFAQRGSPEGFSPALRTPRPGLICFSVVILGTVRSASRGSLRRGRLPHMDHSGVVGCLSAVGCLTWIALVLLAASHGWLRCGASRGWLRCGCLSVVGCLTWIAPVPCGRSAASRGSLQCGRLPQRGLLPQRALLCFSAFFHQPGPSSPFSRGVVLNGFLFLRVVLPGALFSSVQFSTLLFPPRGSAWHDSPPVHPQRSSTACVSLLCGSPSSFLSVAQGAGLHGRACDPHAASSRGQKPRQNHAALWRLHLRFVASAPSSFVAKAPSSFRCRGPIFIPLRFHIHSVVAAPCSFRSDAGPIFVLRTVV